MIDKLLCFDNGFIKFENNFSRICAMYKPENAYFALFDGKLYCYEFSHHILIDSPIKKLPCAFGIFDKFNNPVFISGNSSVLKEEFFKAHPPKEKDVLLTKTTILEKEESTKEPEAEQELTIEQNEEKTLIDAEFTALLSENDEPQTFWQCNAKTFLEKLAAGEKEEELSSLIPGSRWSKPENEEYVMGVIFDENEDPMYLCYGFENVWSETPPEDFEGYSQWIPKNFADPHAEGYWVIYINALTGERVK